MLRSCTFLLTFPIIFQSKSLQPFFTLLNISLLFIFSPYSLKLSVIRPPRKLHTLACSRAIHSQHAQGSIEKLHYQFKSNCMFRCSTVRTWSIRPGIVEEIVGREETRRRKNTRGAEKERRGTKKVNFFFY